MSDILISSASFEIFSNKEIVNLLSAVNKAAIVAITDGMGLSLM
jgi:hypothetical protein